MASRRRSYRLGACDPHSEVGNWSHHLCNEDDVDSLSARTWDDYCDIHCRFYEWRSDTSVGREGRMTLELDSLQRNIGVSSSLPFLQGHAPYIVLVSLLGVRSMESYHNTHISDDKRQPCWVAYDGYK